MALRAAVLEGGRSFLDEFTVDELDPSIGGQCQPVLQGLDPFLRGRLHHARSLAPSRLARALAAWIQLDVFGSNASLCEQDDRTSLERTSTGTGGRGRRRLCLE